MGSCIHSSAVIHKTAYIGADVDIGPFVVIGPNVRIGDQTHISPYCHVVRRTEIGSCCRLSTSAVIGGDPQDIKFKGEDTDLIIGNHNRIGEFVTINRGTGVGGGSTRIGDNNMIMAYTHIAHDCIIGNNVIITNSCQLAGHVKVEDMAWISGLCAIHHFVTVGTLSFIAPRSGVRFDVPPYMTVDGFNEAARVRTLNLEGLRRRQVPEESISALKKALRLLYRSSGVPLRDSIARLEAEAAAADPYVGNLIRHVRASLLGYQNRALERTRIDKARPIPRQESAKAGMV